MKKKSEEPKEFETVKTAIGEEHFPPCIKKIYSGMQDGKKRAVFILINFLSTCGWDYDKIESNLLEWNKKNPEPMRENIIIGQCRYAKAQNKKVLPPNCDNQMYYRDLQICFPDNFCRKIKNPANYTIIKNKIKMKVKQEEEEKQAKKEAREARAGKKKKL